MCPQGFVAKDGAIACTAEPSHNRFCGMRHIYRGETGETACILRLMDYRGRVLAELSPAERRLFRSMSTPERIQDFLDSVPINFELSGPTNFSPRTLLLRHQAHCFEGAVFAAAVLASHGQPPLLMDFATTYDDEDHTVALFKRDGLWGAISKTNHAVLRYRDPIYRSPRELAMSYVHEYYMHDGRKSLRAYSQPFDLSRYAPEKWITTGESLDWLMASLARSRYLDIAPSRAVRKLRRVRKTEIKVLDIRDWERPAQ